MSEPNIWDLVNRGAARADAALGASRAAGPSSDEALDWTRDEMENMTNAVLEALESKGMRYCAGHVQRLRAALASAEQRARTADIVVEKAREYLAARERRQGTDAARSTMADAVWYHDRALGGGPEGRGSATE